jgi:hypothetical protein
MLSLDSPRWSEFCHAYGDASDIPALLRRLEDLPESHGRDEPWFSLWSALAHQGDVYSASFAAVPHVVAAIARAPMKASAVYFQFPARVEIFRQQKGIAVPSDLQPAYTEALSKLPALVAATSSREWDQDFLLCALSAIAAAKGYASVAEAVEELTPDIAAKVMQWIFEG